MLTITVVLVLLHFHNDRFVLLYPDTRWGLQVHLCFTKELGEVLSYNWFLAGGIDHSRVRMSLVQCHF